jgi:hypothetical protein
VDQEVLDSELCFSTLGNTATIARTSIYPLSCPHQVLSFSHNKPEQGLHGRQSRMSENFSSYPSHHSTPTSTNTPYSSESKPLKMIGVVGTNGTEEDLQIVYMLRCDYWRKGYMSEALIAVFGLEGAYWSLSSKLFFLSIYIGLYLTNWTRSHSYQEVESPNRPRECRLDEDYCQNWGEKGRDSF